MLRLCIIVMLFINICASAILMPSNTVIWTVVFSDVTPIKNATKEYCEAHTPTTVITTLDQITSAKGVDSLNGINIRYLSYKTTEKDNLYFNVVDAVISGRNPDGSTWSTPMKLYEQTLNAIDVTQTVWSTPFCKGHFLGTPTVIKLLR